MFTTDTVEEAELLRTLFCSIPHSGQLKGRHIVQSINRAGSDTEALAEMDRLGRHMEMAYERMKNEQETDKHHNCTELSLMHMRLVYKDGVWHLYRGEYTSGAANYCPGCGVELRTL